MKYHKNKPIQLNLYSEYAVGIYKKIKEVVSNARRGVMPLKIHKVGIRIRILAVSLREGRHTWALEASPCVVNKGGRIPLSTPS